MLFVTPRADQMNGTCLTRHLISGNSCARTSTPLVGNSLEHSPNLPGNPFIHHPFLGIGTVSAQQ